MKDYDLHKTFQPRRGTSERDSHKPEDFDWREYYFAIKERRCLVIFCVMILTLWGVYKASSQIFQYRASALLLIEQGKSRVLDQKLESLTDDQIKSIDAINTLVALLDSYPFALRVVNRLQLAQEKSFQQMAGIFRKNSSPEQMAGVIEGMVRSVYIPSTDLIDISVTSRSSEVSVKLANAYAEEYLHYAEDQKREAIRAASTFLMDEAERLRKKMRASEEGMQNFREREKAASIEAMLQEAQARLSDASARQHALNNQLAQIHTDLEVARADKGDPSALLKLPSVASEPKIALLVAQLADLQKQFAICKLRYRAKHPAYIMLKTQIDLSNADLTKLLGNVLPMLETISKTLSAQEATITSEREKAEMRLLDVTSKSIEYNDLKRELESDRALYESVLSRIKEVDVTKGLSDSSVRIQEHARGGMVVGKSPLSIIFKNFMIGLSLGLGSIFLLHKLDRSFRTIDDIERGVGLPVLAAIPEIGEVSAPGVFCKQPQQLFVLIKECLITLFTSKLSFSERLTQCVEMAQPKLSCFGNPHTAIALPEGSTLVVRDDRNSMAAEAFRSLRVTLGVSPGAETLRTYLFTSAMPGEGKSFCSSNFAITLAQQGLKTLLIDADLRKPVISRIFFGMSRKPGVVEILQKTATLETAIHSTSTERLSILTAGEMTANPSEILAGKEFRDLVTEALKSYDRVVIDSAPVLAVSDTLLIAFQAEILCLVVRAFVTPRRFIQRAIKSLDEIHMRPTGIVFNSLPHTGGDYYYYYTSGKYAGDYNISSDEERGGAHRES